MSVGYFLDKTHPPSSEELKAALGPAFPLWEELVQFIAQTYQVAVDFSYGGKSYGWNLWYRKSGKALISLYPQKDGFIAQVVLGKAEVEKAMALPLGEKVQRLLRDTPQLHDGKWLFIPASGPVDVEDIHQLLLIKRRPSKKT
jgi:hypothetical protein